ncbi:MAG: iron-sulfur cluster assembly protein [Acidimicrobiales bacterium]
MSAAGRTGARAPASAPMADLPTATGVLDALAGVRDPELDEPITGLGFVADLRVEGETVELALRLPTYWCAPGFAWLMAADAEAAIARMPGVRRARVRLVDHFAADEISAGLAEGRGFAASFPGLADGGLEDLRATFRRKALLARQDRLCRSIAAAAGRQPGDAGRPEQLQVADLPPGPDTDAYLHRRRELGIDSSPEAPFLLDEEGRPVAPAGVPTALRRGRAVRVSIEGNASLCRGLLATRYGPGGEAGKGPALAGGGARRRGGVA